MIRSRLSCFSDLHAFSCRGPFMRLGEQIFLGSLASFIRTFWHFEMVRSFCMKKILRYVIFFSKPEQLIPEVYCALIYRHNDIYVLGYLFCDQCFFCRNVCLRCIETILYRSSGMPNLTHLCSIKQGYTM